MHKSINKNNKLSNNGINKNEKEGEERTKDNTIYGKKS